MTEQKLKLEIELVPVTVWQSSLYRLLPRKVWNEVRNETIRERGRKCQICGETEGVISLHEIWRYDDEKYVQKLEGFILLCEMCHHVKHIFLAGILSKTSNLNYDKVIEHFCKVNSCTRKYFEEHEAKAFKIWEKRSKHKWRQDFGKFADHLNGIP